MAREQITPESNDSTSHSRRNYLKLATGGLAGVLGASGAGTGSFSDSQNGVVQATTTGSPVIDSFNLSPSGELGDNQMLSVRWSVEDPDGDLETVQVVVDDGSFNMDFSVTDITGETASNWELFQFPIGAILTVSVRVEDTAGNVTTEQQTIRLTGADDTPLSDLDRARVEQFVHYYVNKERADAGLAELSFDTDLREIARYHSRDMAENDYFSHTSPDGKTYEDRYEKFGYDCRAYIDDSQYYTGGENIAYTYYNQDVTTDWGVERYTNADELAAAIVRGWMNSEGHRENILTEAWGTEGIGVVVTDAGKVYATQNFC